MTEAHSHRQDEFKVMEKKIKNYARDVISVQKGTSKRQRDKQSKNRPEVDNSFDWKEVIDVYTSADGTPAVSIHNLSSIVQGLYVIANALSVEQQIYWAIKALEEYSAVEHNNLTNLQALKSAERSQEASTSADSASASSTASKYDMGDEVEVVADIPSNLSDLWRESSTESIPFSSFAKLRWSCLGYHYGKPHMS